MAKNHAANYPHDILSSRYEPVQDDLDRSSYGTMLAGSSPWRVREEVTYAATAGQRGLHPCAGSTPIVPRERAAA